MGWDDCFDFNRLKFTQPDRKAKEIWRVLRKGGKFLCCAWERQEDVSWMESAILRHYPAILKDSQYQAQRPIGMAYEKADGYMIILRSAGFREITISTETMSFLSTDEEEWWQQMVRLGWEPFLQNIGKQDAEQLQRIKTEIFNDLQQYKHADGLHFDKTVFFVQGLK
jgi:ubiquinone/menaquinone biosynthesis C-methylase UbiE